LSGCALPALVLLAAAGFARADELRTHGGEVLVGTVIEHRPDAVVFESKALGRVTVKREAIASVVVSPRESPAVAAPAAAAAKAESTEAEQAQAQAAEERKQALGTDAVGRFLARINVLKDWKTKLGLGFIRRRGEDNDSDLTLRFQSERKTEAGDEHQLEARYYYAEDILVDGSSTATDELLTGSYRFRRPLSERWFFQARTSYYRDAIKELDNEVTQTVGVGLRTKGERWQLSFTPAGGVQWREVAGDQTTKVVGGFYQEFGSDLTATLRLAQTLDYLVAVDDSDDYSARFGVDLNQKLGSAWSLGLRYEYNYDSVVGKDASEEQERITLSIGLEF
jgi:hypothetical protein